jgi:hypothetical protein
VGAVVRRSFDGQGALRPLRDPQLERNAHRSRNRIESYQQMRDDFVIDPDAIVAGLKLG